MAKKEKRRIDPSSAEFHEERSRWQPAFYTRNVVFNNSDAFSGSRGFTQSLTLSGDHCETLGPLEPIRFEVHPYIPTQEVCTERIRRAF
jgi:hypothetical protein